MRLPHPSVVHAATIAAAATLVVTFIGIVAVPALASPFVPPTTTTSAASTPSPVDTASPTATPTPAATETPVPVPAPTVSPTPVVTPPATPYPLATAIDRASGDTSGTRLVTVQGFNLSNVASVLVGGVAATSLKIIDANSLQFTIGTAPNFQPGVVSIALVAASDGTTQPTDLSFRYVVHSKVDREMQYAFTHWNTKKNARFGYIPGNDCANFVSQLLQARGWRETSAWYNNVNKITGDVSATWVSSTAMSDWLHTRSDLATRISYTDRASVVVGDIVQFNWGYSAKKNPGWDHSAVVSRVVVLPNGAHDIYYVAHTNAQAYGGSVMTLVSNKPTQKGTTMRVQFWHLRK